MNPNPDDDPITSKPHARVFPDDGVVVRLDPDKEREQITAHRAAREKLRHDHRAEKVTGRQWMRAVLTIAAMIAIVVAAFLLLVTGPGNPMPPPPCMPPSCV